MTDTSVSRWEAMRTDETRQVEELLKNAGFEKADAYRYNPAAIRVRVIDSRFEGLRVEQRDDMVEPYLEQLPERTQADIMTLLTFAPSEIQQAEKAFREFYLNMEFENPTPSIL